MGRAGACPSGVGRRAHALRCGRRTTVVAPQRLRERRLIAAVYGHTARLPGRHTHQTSVEVYMKPSKTDRIPQHDAQSPVVVVSRAAVTEACALREPPDAGATNASPRRMRFFAPGFS